MSQVFFLSSPFEIGFHRKVCANGLILRQSVINFRFSHLQRDIGAAIKFDIAHEGLAKLKNSFDRFVKVLWECPVERADFEPLLFTALKVRTPSKIKEELHVRDAEDWNALEVHSRNLCQRYASELGENAYATFNAITEFASNPPDNRWVRRDRRSLQRLAGEWVHDFSNECSQQGFKIGSYLSSLPSSPI